MFRVVRLAALSGLSALSLAQAAGAAPVQASPKATADLTIVRPLSLIRQADLDFATLGVTTGGSATIDPITGSMIVSGGLIHLGGTPSPARYAGAALRQTVVNIRIPNQPLLITRVGGTETLTVSDFTLDGQNKRNMAQQTSFAFAVGARVTVPAGAVDGIYLGDLDVTVQYP